MDQELIKRLGDDEANAGDSSKALETTITWGADMGDIELVQGDRREPYTLKSLPELYGKGGSGTVDPKDPAFMPLFLSIEETIAKFDEIEHQLTDGEILLDLNEMGMRPEAPSDKLLIQRIQFALRLTLSLNDYSRQEVRQALRRLVRSVELHSEGGRGRGYLNFAKQFLPGIGKGRR